VMFWAAKRNPHSMSKNKITIRTIVERLVSLVV
jgi:hypothetical protein